LTGEKLKVILELVNRTLYSSAIDRGSDVASLFAKINSNPLELPDYYGLEKNASELLKIEDIVVAEVYDIDRFRNTFDKSASIDYHLLPVSEKIFTPALMYSYEFVFIIHLSRGAFFENAWGIRFSCRS
jgi:hypothetical protein